jgi:hypothetical protein
MALLCALTVAGLAGVGSRVAAQTATPDEATTTDFAAAKAASYDTFIATLATELSLSDPAQVDAAIRTALKQLVDERLAAGELSVEAAAAQKAVIDVTEAPLMLGIGMEGRFPGGHGPMGGPGHGPRGGFDGPRGGFEGRDKQPAPDELPGSQDAPVEQTPTA